MHAFIILNFLDKINAFNHEKVLYQMSKCTFTFPMQCLFGRQKEEGCPKIHSYFKNQRSVNLDKQILQFPFEPKTKFV